MERKGDWPCEICGLKEALMTHMPDSRGQEIDCPRCGKYRLLSPLTYEMEFLWENRNNKPLRPYLSAFTRQEFEQGRVATLTTENWREFAQSQRAISVSTKTTKLLELIAKRSPGVGKDAEINTERDYPLLAAQSGQEVDYFLDYLGKQKLITENQGKTGKVGLRLCYLTMEGWKHLEPQPGGIPGRCFVAMSFDSSLDEAYQKGIYLAVREDCKCDPVRLKEVEHNEKICDKIIAEIRRCQFVVADFTRQNQGAYFEAGFAMGLGRPVIWTCSKEEEEKLHFDTRQYNHIIWDTPEDLRQKLVDRINATIKKS